MAQGAHGTVENPEGGWPAGWAIAALAGAVAAALTRWLGDTSMTAAVLIGLVVFMVYGVLLGMFWSAPAAGGPAEGHGHGDDHAHAPSAPLAAMATVAAGVAAQQAVAPSKPVGLAGPRGVADDLQSIEGIGPVLEQLLHDLGIYHFDQIAAWGQSEVSWLDSNLKGFKGRASRDRWVRQAGLIGEIGLEPFKLRARTNDY